jgi:pilus assembly protein CpaE
MKALLISRDSQLYAEIASQGAARVPPLNVGASRVSMRDALDRPVSDNPALVILDASDIEAADADLLERLARHYHAAHFMLLTREHQQDLLIRAMRAGVREVLQLPLVHRAFHEAMDRIAATAGVSHMRDGKVLAFISCKGGSGATFISTNFGYALATLADKKVLLIDLHGQFGDATLYVSDQKPAMTLSDVCSQIARMDGPSSNRAWCMCAGFGVLAAADDPAQAVEPSPSTWMPSCAWRASTTTTSCSMSAARSTPCRCARWTVPTPSIRCCSWRCRISATAPPARHLPLAGLPLENTRLIVNRYEKGGKLRLQDLQRRSARKWCTRSPTTTWR